MMPQKETFVGLDVSKASLEGSVLGEPRTWRVGNNPEGWARLIERCRDLGEATVGVEPSGGYERGVVQALKAAGVEVRWTEPARVRALATALGAPAKTDPIDARMIARYVAETGGRPILIDEEREGLKDLLAARSAVQDTAGRLMRQAEGMRPGAARASLAALAEQAQAEVKALTRQIHACLRASQALQPAWRLLQTAPGVGPLVAAELLACLPELGRVSSKAIAKLAGLAPFIRKSGLWKGQAKCSGGRPRPRRMLYLAAMASLRTADGLRPIFQALVQNGKPRKLALTACMRRLLVRLNAMLRDQAPWQNQPA